MTSRLPLTLALAATLATAFATAAGAQQRLAPAATNDPRANLGAGFLDARSAIRNMELVASKPRPESFTNPRNPGDFGYINSDLAFRGNLLFQGGYWGIQIWDITDPANPAIRATIPCPGGQGDVSVHGNLLLMSVEEPRGRVDCGTQGVRDSVSAERFVGVRIFDISDLDKPVQVAAVQTCRGSHTHTIFQSPRDRNSLWVYVSGTSPARSGSELAGCSNKAPTEDPNTSLFRIDVIRVPLARPQDARVVSGPRVFALGSRIAGLNPGGKPAPDAQESAETDQCHDITVYAELGLAAGACSGNGILLDIRDPANPRRVAEVSDPNFAYWHSATFNNAGTSVVFTDEWGGGVFPRCRATDRPEWGANAYFRLGRERRMTPAGYFKLPAAQTAQENCVAHNGSLIPVPGRDLMVQAWYQGGISVVDFTDPDHPVEIAYFDRGPMDAQRLVLGGQWSTYWYNGHIYGSEIGRGLDVLKLVPSGALTQNELDAANLARVEVLNPQDQRRITWPVHFAVAKAYLDQLGRSGGLMGDRFEAVTKEIADAEGMSGADRRRALQRTAGALDRDARTSTDAARVRALAAALRALAR